MCIRDSTEIVYTDQDCKDDISEAIKILKQEGVTLVFKSKLFENIPLFRPKLPR